MLILSAIVKALCKKARRQLMLASAALTLCPKGKLTGEYMLLEKVDVDLEEFSSGAESAKGFEVR